MAAGSTALWARASGVFPLVGALTSAAALTGLAVFTVSQASCADTGQYVRNGDRIELVGGCIDRDDLPPAKLPDRDSAKPDSVEGIGHFRP